MDAHWVTVGVCGLSCRLCPMFQSTSQSRCNGCKSPARIAVGCPFIRCASKQGLEYCGDCSQSATCEKWQKHQKASKTQDSFVCYQKLESNIKFISEQGIEEFDKEQIAREKLLRDMLSEYNEGRSKTLFCVACTVFEVDELQEALEKAKMLSEGLTLKERAKVMHEILEEKATQKNYLLKLRK